RRSGGWEPRTTSPARSWRWSIWIGSPATCSWPTAALRCGARWIPPTCSRAPDVAHVHHSAIYTRDVDASLRFYRDGLGLQVLMDHEFDGDWRTLFDAPGNRLRSVFLGDPDTPDAGIVELVSFSEDVTGDGGAAPSPAPPEPGSFLLSFFVDVADTLTRLAALGLEG